MSENRKSRLKGAGVGDGAQVSLRNSRSLLALAPLTFTLAPLHAAGALKRGLKMLLARFCRSLFCFSTWSQPNLSVKKTNGTRSPGGGGGGGDLAGGRHLNLTDSLRRRARWPQMSTRCFQHQTPSERHMPISLSTGPIWPALAPVLYGRRRSLFALGRRGEVGPCFNCCSSFLAFISTIFPFAFRRTCSVAWPFPTRATGNRLHLSKCRAGLWPPSTNRPLPDTPDALDLVPVARGPKSRHNYNRG